MADASILPDAKPWTETEGLNFEKEALGLYMSGHPLQRYAGVLAAFNGLVDVVSIPPSGKAAALNAGVARASHDILVFADARQRFAGAVEPLDIGDFV